MGYVYLLMTVDDLGNETYKIGVTKRNIETRICELQTGNSRKLTLLKSYESDNYLKVEGWLHKKYHTKTEAENEWRSLTNEEIMSFQENCNKADEIIKFMLANNPFYK